jgi:hypothetical protein
MRFFGLSIKVYKGYMVSETKQKELLKRMEDLGIKESDILEKFIRSRGHGGQNVNNFYMCLPKACTHRNRDKDAKRKVSSRK